MSNKNKHQLTDYEWRFKLSDFVDKLSGKDKDLAQIYLEREYKMRELLRNGKTWEEARAVVDAMDFQERIDVLCPPPKKKRARNR